MRTIVWLPFSCAVILTLSGCANNGGSAGSSPSGTGPFDSQGNYHEEWANDPSKWRKPGSHSQPAAPSDELPVVTKNEQPPPNASPFAAPEAATLKSPTGHASSASRASARHTEPSKAANSKHKAPAEEPAAHKTGSHTAKTTTHKATSHTDTSEPAPHVHKAKTAVHDDSDAPKAKTSTKAKTKSSTKGSRYVVKKGDSVDSIAEHSDASAAEIRKANSLSGNRLQPGKTLVIPK